MAQIVITDGYTLINAVNESSACTACTIDYKAEVKDITPYGSTSKARIGGLKDWSAKLEFNIDYANGANEGRIFAMIGTAVPVEFRATSGARSTSNPAYVGTGIVEGYTPITGKVGDQAKTSVSIVCSNGVALQRLTA
jgi:hypothetical protein